MSAKKQIQDLSKEFLPQIIDIRRNLHSNPELSFQEFETSKYIKSILADWGIPFQEHIADTGIVVLLKGKNSEKSCTALRADFDAAFLFDLIDESYSIAITASAS